MTARQAASSTAGGSGRRLPSSHVRELEADRRDALLSELAREVPPERIVDVGAGARRVDGEQARIARRPYRREAAAVRKRDRELLLGHGPPA